MGGYVPLRRDDGDEPTLENATQRGSVGGAPVDLPSIRPTVSDAERYQERQRIGIGAMGEVSLCLDRRLGRDLAMKVIRSDRAEDATARLRFEREARVQRQLEHPAIVPIHDLGATPDGGMFFTMKRVHGESLRAILDGLRGGDAAFVARYGQHRLLSAFGTVCLAVALAHSRGIIHRDIKPANIMFGDFGEVYLLDWGIAHVRRHIGAAEETQEGAIALPPEIEDEAKAGELLGTVGYMPPEQARGEAVDARADVYALGATLFEILTLDRLHPRDTVLALQSTAAGVRRPSEASNRGPSRGPRARGAMRQRARFQPRRSAVECARDALGHRARAGRGSRPRPAASALPGAYPTRARRGAACAHREDGCLPGA